MIVIRHSFTRTNIAKDVNDDKNNIYAVYILERISVTIYDTTGELKTEKLTVVSLIWHS